MTKHHYYGRLSRQPHLSAFIVACAAGLTWGGGALAAPALEPRVLAQLGLDIALDFNLLQNETAMLNNFNVSPPACAKLPYGGSVETLSVTKVSSSQYKSKIDLYFDAACKMPYVEADVTVVSTSATETLSITEAASYRGLNGKALGELHITDVLSVANNVEVLRGLGKFAPVGGQPVADVGFTCNAPTTGKTSLVGCQGGVAQNFRLLDLSIASVVPFNITAGANNTAPKLTFTGTQSNVQTGPAGSLSITAPTPQSLGIGGGGTAYTSTTISGSEAHYALFPIEPTSWTVMDQANNAQLSYRVASDKTRAARGTIETISPSAKLASIMVDKSGSGKITYSDGSPVASIRSFLAAN